MDYFDITLEFLGSLGLFIFGMSILANGLQKSAGNRMKRILEALTKNRLAGVLLGTAVTAVIQSSSATTVMVVGFVNAGVMNLGQSVGVIMGANIGTTVTSWLVASIEWAELLNPKTIAPIATVIGAFMYLFSDKRTIKQAGEIIVGLGILFLGMTRMPEALKPLSENDVIMNLFVTMGTNPLFGILAGVIVTGIIQSSSVSVGILQSLALAGLMPWNAAVYIIMGQNIGTCVTAMLSSIGVSRAARSAALVHLLFNVFGTIIFGTLSIIFFSFINPEVGFEYITITQIGIVHTGFNIANTIILFPFGNVLMNLATRITNLSKAPASESEAIHLTESILKTPSVALESCVMEISRLGAMAHQNLKLAAAELMEHTEGAAQKVYEREDSIDSLEETITTYLVKILNQPINPSENQDATSLFHTLSDLERIGDHAENIAELAESLHGENIIFSDTAKDELNNIIQTTLACVSNAVEALAANDRVKAAECIEQEAEVDRMKDDYKAGHINRLQNAQCSLRGGVIFLETINNLERVTDHAKNIAQAVQKSSR